MNLREFAMKTLLLSLCALGLTGTAALADAAGRIDYRQARQIDRIERGIANGSLNRGETVRLLRGQEHIDRMERRAEADGYLSRRERYHIWRAQNAQSRAIWFDRHNWY
jgi:hypothetical protein